MEVQVQRGIMQHPYDVLVKGVMRVLEANLLPDFLLRRITRTLLARSLHLGYKPNTQLQLQDLMAFINSLKRMPIALSTEKPKAQHYELPTSFFKLVLGKNLKYSSCYFASDTNTLDEAEESMLSLYCERAQIKDGQTILDIGCGWGSLTLYMAKKYPNSHVTGICNSTTQKEYIIEKSSELGMSNIVIYAGDITSFKMESTFDRIISIEMFEDINEDDWMARYFFTGGTMPAASLLLFFQEHVSVIEHWLVNGKHYARTSEEWLKNMDKNMKFIYPILIDTYSVDSAKKWMVYWRTFFIAVAELFGYNDGDEWMVSHFLFKKK
ncbi:(S)-coclaurine N-methyltransferase isoform X2 [Cryptomeria japonica]|uniref:(S)-coclaurine N-methyltransferase isoform X2 n=1 Tax=Cryptomeria japonica TaxID=3369 RepID=UPI0025AC55EA|nr:(S)-coclaurine N-methyltransferase isoform X2 [Cryptomeria japonica]